ncbi:SGNH/GDSL hydrolase family protein [Weissella halotolerans]|uniref:SGNH hydrolase-type esterase domain-containing protein n=1 Tax=Weissella halotolerans DSM 20190 TaxID=1123500 RepID=A0A0R2FZ42_9LACO|nr:SGNH/GDSL hydrolase family protein [Weissella halotolerans]KRN33214.1 hypothetical protein IV68_GL000012 [Weissella halotolerans DSM 20190]
MKAATIIALGDSLTSGYEPNGPGNGGWPKFANALFADQVLNEGVAGATWQTGSRNDAISFVQRVKIIDWAKAQKAILFGGTNDYGQSLPIGQLSDQQSNTMLGAMNQSLATIYQANPTILLYVLTPTWRNRLMGKTVGVEEEANQQGLLLVDYVQAIEAWAHYYHLPVLNLYQTMNINHLNAKSWLLDGLHPTPSGHQRLAKTIMAFVQTYH